MSDNQENEDLAKLSEQQTDIHRLLVSAKEELEAIDFYRQRVDLTKNSEIRSAFTYILGDEYEHLSILLETLRRQEPEFDKQLRKFLFKDQDIALTIMQGTDPDRDGD
jgi:hypothetical protein